MSLIKSSLWLLICLSLFSCNSGESESNESTTGNQGSSNLEAFWNSSDFPLEISVSSDLDAAEATAISSTLDEWDNAVSAESFFSATLPSVSDPKHASLELYRDNTIGVYEVEAADPLSDASIDEAKALAVTQFYATVENNGGVQYYRIIHADIFINKKYYIFTTVSDDTKYDFPSVVVHEMGHLLGLGHISFEEQSVMNPSISKSTEKRNLFAEDSNNIADLYDGGGASAAKVELSASQMNERDKGVVRVVTQLMPNGECHHYEDGKLAHSHKR